MATILEVNNLDGGYGKTQIIYNVSLAINKGEVVSLIGHNGAGKSTTLKIIFGLLKPYRGKVTYAGQDITGQSPARNVKNGICFIPQERFIFDNLTVRENLDMSSYAIEDKSEIASGLETIYELFPILRQRLEQKAGTLSGGERRMLSLGMALSIQPQLLILDEPSLGLAPTLVSHVVSAITKVNRSLGVTVFLVEQNVKQAFKISNRVYVMKTGHIILEETGQKLLERSEWWDLF